MRDAVAPLAVRLHHLCMAQKPSDKIAGRANTQIRAWRKHRGMSLEKAVERLDAELSFDYSVGQLSRVERSEMPYSQDLLEALATIYRCGPGDLLMRDPTSPDAIWSIWEQLAPQDRQQVVEIAKTFKKAG